MLSTIVNSVGSWSFLTSFPTLCFMLLSIHISQEANTTHDFATRWSTFYDKMHQKSSPTRLTPCCLSYQPRPNSPLLKANAFNNREFGRQLVVPDKLPYSLFYALVYSHISRGEYYARLRYTMEYFL